MTITTELFNPIPGKGAGREFSMNEEVENEENYIELGLIVRNEKNEFVKDAVVTISATDISQNKILNGTGAYRRIVRDGAKMIAPFYPFHYEFKTAGKHTITFTCEGVVKSVDLIVGAKKPKKDKKPK